MSRRVIERKLVGVGEQLRKLRGDLLLAEEQLLHFQHEADETRVRSFVSETALSDRVHRSAERYARIMQDHRDSLNLEIEKLEMDQNSLLDRLNSSINDS
tara:strand:+ start:235 stop:534 length:300 start_codon:yes stop_codon:yes gene_type:complete